jgi:hypothetical protein
LEGYRVASSGTYSFSVSNGEVVLAAYERIKIFAPSIRIEHMMSARRELNFLLAEAANKQVNLWKVDKVSTPLINGQTTYAVDARTVMILDAWITTGTGVNASDTYITPISRTEYASFSDKATPGRPTCYWFDRLIAPTVTVWPVPNQSNNFVLNYYRCVQMQDANLAGGETPDIPYRWIDWFVAGMAHRLCRPYATIELEKLRKADAVEAWTVAATQDTENVVVTLSPNISAYYRR